MRVLAQCIYMLHFSAGFSHKTNASGVDLNCVRLAFQVCLFHSYSTPFLNPNHSHSIAFSFHPHSIPFFSFLMPFLSRSLPFLIPFLSHSYSIYILFHFHSISFSQSHLHYSISITFLFHLSIVAFHYHTIHLPFHSVIFYSILFINPVSYHQFYFIQFSFNTIIIPIPFCPYPILILSSSHFNPS